MQRSKLVRLTVVPYFVCAGVLIVNIVARSDTLYAEAIAAIAAVFPVVLEMAVEEDVNRIVVAMAAKRTGISSSKMHALDCYGTCIDPYVAPIRMSIYADSMFLRRAKSDGLAKSTVELHRAAGAAWGPNNPNAMWTEEVTSAATTALRTAKVVANDGKVAPGIAGKTQPGRQAPQQKAAPAGGKKKSTKSKKKKKK